MKTVFSTEDVHRRDRFSYWHEVACMNLVRHEATPETRLGFDAEMRAGKIAALELVLFRNSAMTVSRTRAHCSKQEDDALFLCQQLEGRLEIQQAGRETRLGKGEMVLLDPALPYSGAFCSSSELLVLKLPRQALRARLGETSGLLGLPTRAAEVEHGLTAALLSTLPECAEKVCPSTAAIMQTYCVDLVATMMGKLAGKSGTHMSSTRASALMAVRIATECRLSEPGLSPARIAAAAGISVRYANSLLASEGTSLSRLMLSMRLDRCRKALGDPAQAHRTVSEIAYAWGFSDMTHFGRAFRRAYGMLPTDHRRMAARVRSADR